MRVVLTGILLFSVAALWAQDPQPDIRKGNELYRQQQYKEAEAAYAEASKADPENSTAAFNKATAIYRQSRPADAIKGYDDLAFKTLDKSVKSKSYYNKGVILTGQKKLEESIEAYKNALRQDPNDNEARENLQKALMEQKKKKPEPQKKDDKKQQQQKDQQQKQQPQPRMNKKEAQQRLKLLEQKEKDVQERLQKSKSSSGGGQRKDW